MDTAAPTINSIPAQSGPTRGLGEGLIAGRSHSRSSSDSIGAWRDRTPVSNGIPRPSSTASRLRQRQTSPRRAIGDAVECERIQQVFFPPFEEAGHNAILHIATGAGQHTVFHHHCTAPSAGSDTQAAAKWRPRPAENRSIFPPEHSRARSRDSTTSLPPFGLKRRGQAFMSESDSGIHLAPGVLRESGLLLNSPSSLAMAHTTQEQADDSMEIMEMRPWGLQRSATTSHQDRENVKPPLLRCNTIASSRPTKRKAMSADMGSRGRFQGITAIQPLETTPQITSSSRSTKPRPPPLRELPPPSWSSPGHSPPLTSLAPPFSRDMFLFPIKNSVNLSPVSPIYHRPFSTMMSPPCTPETRVTKYELSTRTPLAPSALSTSHLGQAHYLDVIDSHLRTANRCRRRSSMSSFGSTTATIRPWDVRGEITPKASKTPLVAEAMEAEPLRYQDFQERRRSSSVQQCEAEERGGTDASPERNDRCHKTEKRSRLEDCSQDKNKAVESTKNARRRAEGRKVSGTLRL